MHNEKYIIWNKYGVDGLNRSLVDSKLKTILRKSSDFLLENFIKKLLLWTNKFREYHVPINDL